MGDNIKRPLYPAGRGRELGRRVFGLSDEELDRLDRESPLNRHIEEARKLKAEEARRTTPPAT